MDVYRIGTLLELARQLASTLAQDGAHVKVCVQQSMGAGVFQVGRPWVIQKSLLPSSVREHAHEGPENWLEVMYSRCDCSNR